MTVLTILRHAKSSWDESGLSDFDRPLNGRGRDAAPRVGREMRDRKMAFDSVFASPAVRVRETIDGLARGYGQGLDVQFDQELYLAGAQTLFRKVRGLPATAHSPLLVGHNPGLHDLVLKLTREDENALREQVSGNLPTAAVVMIELPANRWNEVEWGSGQISELILPRELS